MRLLANAIIDSKSLKYVCTCVNVFILQPCNSSQEESKPMNIFKSFWGLISLKSSRQKYTVTSNQKQTFSWFAFSCNSFWIVQLFLRDCSHISSKKGKGNTRTWLSPIKSVIYKCIFKLDYSFPRIFFLSYSSRPWWYTAKPQAEN